MANEDAILIAAPLLAIADGVGGNRAGEQASALALDVVRAVTDDPEQELRNAVHQANGAVCDAGTVAWRKGMATTLVAALVSSTTVTVAHVGDSRAYLLRDGQLTQLTVDHSLVSTLLADGRVTAADVRTHPMRSVILRAVGLDACVRPDATTFQARNGDVLLLCSDGLTDALDDKQLAHACRSSPDLDRLVERLAAGARAAGSGDDVTVVAARLG